MIDLDTDRERRHEEDIGAGRDPYTGLLGLAAVAAVACVSGAVMGDYILAVIGGLVAAVLIAIELIVP